MYEIDSGVQAKEGDGRVEVVADDLTYVASDADRVEHSTDGFLSKDAILKLARCWLCWRR